MPKAIVLAVHLTILAAFGLVLAFWPIEDPKLFDANTRVACLTLVGVLAATATVALARNIRALDMMLAWCYIFILTRAVHYLVSPSTVSLVVSEMPVSDINSGIVAFSWLTLVFVVGVALPYWRPISTPPIRDDACLPEGTIVPLTSTFFILCTIEIFVYSQASASIYGLKLFEKSSVSMPLKVALTVASSEFFLFGIIYWFLSHRRHRPPGPLTRIWPWIAMFAACTYYVYAAALSGSRSGGFRIFLIDCAIVLALPTSLQRVASRAIGLAALAIAANIVTIPLTHHVRDEFTARNEIAPNYPQSTETEPAAMNSPDTSPPPAEDRAFKGNLVRIANRFGYLDYAIITLTITPAPECVKTYLNWLYYTKNVVNFLLPGDPFEEARLNSSNAFGICYRGADVTTMPSYHSEIWTLTGLAKVMSHGHETTICLVLGIIFGMISRALQGRRGCYNQMVYSFWVYAFPFVTLFTMGVDHSIITCIIFLLRMAFMITVVQLSLAAWGHFRPGVREEQRRVYDR